MTHWSGTQRLTFVANMLATLSLLGSLLIGFVWPEYLPRLHMTPPENQMLALNLVSFLLLTAYLQRSLCGGWRVFSLVGAFVVMAESCLIALS